MLPWLGKIVSFQGKIGILHTENPTDRPYISIFFGPLDCWLRIIHFYLDSEQDFHSKSLSVLMEEYGLRLLIPHIPF